MLKLNENPPLTWPDKRIQEFDGTWWVVHCKSRNEKALAWSMIHKKINYFLPMNWEVRKSNGRTIRTLLPLFSGYIFFCENESQRLEVLRTNRVANIINVQDQAQLASSLSQLNYRVKFFQFYTSVCSGELPINLGNNSIRVAIIR